MDSQFAQQLHSNLNCLGVTENAIMPNNHDKENYRPKTLVDQTLEIIDPTPNVHTLFVQFDTRFFRKTLLSVEVKWSNRMTSCAGVCSFHPRSRQCTISLSLPLLKLRPRKDLVETLLHEMIHAYLFLTNNDRDRDGHGPEFCKHMNRINKEAGTNITIYHDFHAEVRLYKQHWWKCNGPCQHKPPYFGIVRRAMNRAPGPSDFWYAEHKFNCGGQFVKIKEPENYGKSKGKVSSGVAKTSKKPKSSQMGIKSFISTTVTTVTNPKNIPNSIGGITKLGNSSNNVYGWSATGKTPMAASTPKKPFETSGISIGGKPIGRSNLLDKLDPPKKNKPKTNNFSNGAQSNQLVNCPVCNIQVYSNEMNKHVDSCLSEHWIDQESSKLTNRNPDVSKSQSKSPVDVTDVDNCSSRKKSRIEESNDGKFKPQNDKTVKCPVCDKVVKHSDINQHLDEICFSTNTNKAEDVVILDSSLSSNEDHSQSIENNSHSLSKLIADGESNKCLVCGIIIPSDVSLNVHLETCMDTIFNDPSTEFEDSDLEIVNDGSTKPNTSLVKEFPCPVCMTLLPENLMNNHLDECLKLCKDDW